MAKPGLFAVSGGVINALAVGAPVGPTVLPFLYLGGAVFVAAWAQVYFLSLAAHRQVERLRCLYLAKALRQDMTFFDSEATGGGWLGRWVRGMPAALQHAFCSSLLGHI
jgi:hypothetical protein